MNQKYRTGGTPSAAEYRGLWKFEASDAADGESFESQMISLEKWIEESRTVTLETDVYHRGDFLNDWTHYIEIENPECLHAGLIETLQSWLRQPGNNHSRIVIPTYTDFGDDGAIMIYPNVVRFGAACGNSLETALAAIREKMK